MLNISWLSPLGPPHSAPPTWEVQCAVSRARCAVLFRHCSGVNPVHKPPVGLRGKGVGVGNRSCPGFTPQAGATTPLPRGTQLGLAWSAEGRTKVAKYLSQYH